MFCKNNPLLMRQPENSFPRMMCLGLEGKSGILFFVESKFHFKLILIVFGLVQMSSGDFNALKIFLPILFPKP